MTDTHMVNGNVSCAVTTNAPVDSVTSFNHLAHMATHIMRNHGRLVLALIGTVCVGTVVHNNFVMIGDVVVEVASCRETFVALRALVGVNDAP